MNERSFSWKVNERSSMQDAAPSTRREGTEARRDQILEAAAAIFAEKGYQRATVREIAARAGIAPGTIYLYFESKRDLLLAIADWLIAQRVDQTLAEMTSLPPEEYLAAITRDRIAFARDTRAFLVALFTEMWTDPELQRRFFSQIVGPLFVTAAAYLRTRIEAGQVRPCRVEVVVPALAGSVIILSVMRALAPEHLMPGVADDELVAELTQLYFRGLQPGPAEETG